MVTLRMSRCDLVPRFAVRSRDQKPLCMISNMRAPTALAGGNMREDYHVKPGRLEPIKPT